MQVTNSKKICKIINVIIISAAGTKEKLKQEVANENITFKTSRSMGTDKVFVINFIDIPNFILSIISFPASLSYY